MKRTRTKILTSLLLSVTIILSNIVSLSAAEIYNGEVVSEEGVIVNQEQKKICEATINDNFEDDSVIVVFNNDTSLELHDFDKGDFSDIGAKKVHELTSYTVEEIKDECIDKAQIEMSASDTYATLSDNFEFSSISEDNLVNYIDDEIKEEYSYFHQMVEIKLNTKSKQNVLDVIRELEKRDDVLVAEPNYIIELDSSSITPNDTYVNKQWAIDKINLPSAWGITTGSKSVNVGIIDSGIKAAHSDLNANVDSTLSKSFIDNSPLTDEYGHGTHVSGIVGAVGNNSRGISGACWNVNLISLKIFDSTGNGNAGNLAEAINYAQANNIDLLNFSGSFLVTKTFKNKYYEVLKEAITNYKGLLVCAAGNQAANIDDPSIPPNDNSMYTIYPSRYTNSNIISVASTGEDDKLYLKKVLDGSSYGKTSVDLAAPGVDIYSTYNGDTSDKYYVNMTGTSMATPYVTGVAALIKSKYPSISADGIKKAILDSVDKVTDLSNKVKTGGRLNAYKALLAVENCKFTVAYNKNGGTGNNMASTTVTYGIPTKLAANSYVAPSSDKIFSGWYANRQSDNKWLYKGANGSGWYIEGSQPSGYSKFLYRDEASLAHTTSVNNDLVTMYAQWIDKSSILIGDVNLDGIINIYDATLIQKYCSGNYHFDPVQLFAADVNKDGVVNVLDATDLQKLIN